MSLTKTKKVRLLSLYDSVHPFAVLATYTLSFSLAEYKELIETAHGGTKKFSSKTNFAKMYITAFPLRAMIVYDNVPDVGVLYDDAIPKLIKINEDPKIQDKVLLRKELRCLNEKQVFFPIQRWEKRKVDHTENKGTKEEKKSKKEVLVLISYNWGYFSIMQTDGKDTRKTVGSAFDLSAGFTASLEYKDGYGSTTEYDGGSWENEKVTVGHDVLGITDEFERGAESYDTPPKSVWNRFYHPC